MHSVRLVYTYYYKQCPPGAGIGKTWKIYKYCWYFSFLFNISYTRIVEHLLKISDHTICIYNHSDMAICTTQQYICHGFNTQVLFYFQLLKSNLIGAGSIIVWSVVNSAILFGFLRVFDLLRVSKDKEIIGKSIFYYIII